MEVAWTVEDDLLVKSPYQNGLVALHNAYEGRVQIAADMSLKLHSARLSDSGVYYCILDRLKIEAAVHLIVEPPRVDSVVEVYSHNTSVTLPCYLHLSRDQRLEELTVWWETDGEVLFGRTDIQVYNPYDSPYVLNFNYSDERNIDKFPHFLPPSLSSGKYNCWYRINLTDKLKPGIPGTIAVAFKSFNDTDAQF
uniref:Ig-like domain-containing protein n=1 Tax=Knipowitschia caucasica TaxID=637954 RepID=A0AAV2L7B9_KNICA